MFLQSKLLLEAGLKHGFGNRTEEMPAPFADWIFGVRPRWKQVHGVSVAQVSAPGQICGEVDALWSERAGQPVGVITADCVPVLLARTDGSRVAAVHAGWRGTRAKITRALFTALGDSPRDWIAAIGPAIGPCCYEVSEELAQDFHATFGEGAVPTHRHLDLPAINAAELNDLGVARVDLIRACTKCSRDANGEFIYNSYRREGSGTRQFSVIQA
jgi:YfiH family protein